MTDFYHFHNRLIKKLYLSALLERESERRWYDFWVDIGEENQSVFILKISATW